VPISVEKKILGFQIAMADSMLVQIIKAVDDLAKESHRFGPRKVPTVHQKIKKFAPGA
jgi:hypothetical protein